MNYGEILKKLDGMRSHLKSGFSISERTFVKEQYLAIIGKGFDNPNCMDCYRDAYILLCNKLKSIINKNRQCRLTKK